MSDITPILEAMVAGATAGVSGVATQAVKDAYATLRDRIKSLFQKAGDDKASAALEIFDDDPETLAPMLARYLDRHAAANDPGVLSAATKVHDVLTPTAIGPGSIAANVITQLNQHGGTGFIGGTHSHHTGTKPDEQ